MFTVLSKHITPIPHAHARDWILISQMCKLEENIKILLRQHLHQYQPINCLKEKHKHLQLERGREEHIYSITRTNDEWNKARTEEAHLNLHFLFSSLLNSNICRRGINFSNWYVLVLSEECEYFCWRVYLATARSLLPPPRLLTVKVIWVLFNKVHISVYSI